MRIGHCADTTPAARCWLGEIDGRMLTGRRACQLLTDTGIPASVEQMSHPFWARGLGCWGSAPRFLGAERGRFYWILVGAVGIENNAGRNFKELGETVRNAETLKRNNRERKGILIGPSMAPRFSRS